ncbi:LytR C-terminal domain-containing protein [Jatrophihabitans fulvus]
MSLGSSSPSTAQKLPLVVLNNTQQTGLASQAAQQFRGGGWTVTDTGNLVNDILSTCAYYDPSVDGSKAAAERLQQQFPAIQRVAERFPELPAGPIVVVLTSDYQPG